VSRRWACSQIRRAWTEVSWMSGFFN